MTASLPSRRAGGVRPLHHHRAHDDRRRRPADHLARDAVLQAGRPVIDVTTGLGYPKKANDARANPLVSLLFSDPTGSGLERPADGARTGHGRGRRQRPRGQPGALRPRVGREAPGDREDDAARAAPALPVAGTSRGSTSASGRSASTSGREGDVAAEPQLFDAHMEEVRSGHSEEHERFHADPVGGASTWDAKLAELGTTLSDRRPVDRVPGRLSVLDPRPGRVDAASRWIRIDGAPAGIPLQPGLACLTAHAPQRRIHVATELPGPRRPRVRATAGGCLSRASSSGGSRRRRAGSRCCAPTPPRRGASGAPPSASSPGAPEWRTRCPRARRRSAR